MKAVCGAPIIFRVAIQSERGRYREEVAKERGRYREEVSGLKIDV